MNVNPYHALFNDLTSDALTLTANHRLAQQLQQYFHQAQQKKSQTWKTATILPLKNWLAIQWQRQFENNQLVCTDEEDLLLWRSVIQNDQDSANLLQVNQTVALVKQAWETLHLWQIDSQQLQDYPQPETQKLRQWSQQFQHYQHDKQRICWVQIPALLLNSNMIALPQKIILLGFNELPPLLAHFFACIPAEVQHFIPDKHNQNTWQLKLKDSEDEINTMATWAQQQWQQGQRKIICVVPNLKQCHTRVATVFCETFTPKQQIPGIQELDLPYNLSVAEDFYQLPLIATALNALSLATQKTPCLETISRLLLSPYINYDATERCLAAMIVSKIHNLQQATQHSIHLLLSQLSQEYYPNATLPQRLQAFFDASKSQGKKSFDCWSRKISDLLQCLGWPGQRPPNSKEYQTLMRWQSLLTDFAKLDQLLPQSTQQQAFRIFAYLCQQVVFQPKMDEKPIQILGLLEAMDIPCESLWIMGLSDEAWPPKPSRNPFLPIELQRQYDMPHACAQRELRYAQQLQQRLINSAQTAILSFPSQEDDKSLQPSPLIKQLAAAPIQSSFNNKHWNRTELELFYDDVGPAITAQEKLLGGSYILKLQAQCPFQAFASLRLGARKQEATSIGLSPIDHGIICHRALDIFWKTVKSQQHLLALTAPEEENHLKQAIDQACHISTNYSNYFLEIEKKHVKKLLTQWLAIEKKRPPFVVLEQETQRHIRINQLAMTIQIDRIDAIDNGQQLIIDYKTGAHNPINKWLEPRLTEPQLPLYYLYAGEKTAGLAYGQVHLSEVTFKGFINSEQGFAGLKSFSTYRKKANLSWQTLTTQWQTSINQSSDAFCSGDARVDPCDVQVCQRCQLQALCRIHSHDNRKE